MYSGVQEEETQAETKMNLARVVICLLTHMQLLTLKNVCYCQSPHKILQNNIPSHMHSVF